jgi:hypothetical protein
MDVVLGQGLAQKHFGDARLGDARRVRRLVDTADHILRHPVGTLPQKLENWAELMGLYRLVSRKEVTHEALLASHRQQVLTRMAEHDGVVLLIHDASELDYTHVEALHDQLGQIGSGSAHRRGYIAQHTLAITPQREVFGLVNQTLHRRRVVPKNETALQRRKHPQRESRLWIRGCDACGDMPAGHTWIDITDRGGDTFEFLSYEHSRGRKYVIRSAKNRQLKGFDHVGDDRIHDHLHDYARNLPSLGTRTIEIAAKAGKHKARQAQLRVAAGPVSLDPTRWTRGEHDGQTLHLLVIHVRETDPPPGIAPLEWILLSNLAAESFQQGVCFQQAVCFQQVCQLIDFYACRPLIEDYHKALKTGMGIEQLQFEHAQRLEPAIALLSVIAALLLQLRHAARQRDADITPANTIVPVIFIRVLSAKLYGQARNDLSVRQFLFGVASLGGHLGRKRDGPPGWLTLWRGWNDLQLMVQGALALRGGG